MPGMLRLYPDLAIALSQYDRVAAGLASSKGAARRLVSQGAVSVDGERVSDPEAAPDADRSFVLRVGRKMKRYAPASRTGAPPGAVPGPRAKSLPSG